MNSMTNISVITTQENHTQLNYQLTDLIERANLPICCDWHTVEKLNNKAIKHIAQHIPQSMSNPFLIVDLDKKGNTIGYLSTVEFVLPLCKVGENGSSETCFTRLQDKSYARVEKGVSKGKPTLTKVSLDWHKLQRRIVTAGRKSELLLQACKLTAESRVLDATAGFGHDSLIMASSGARVTMMEQNPIMAFLLMLERERMNIEKNWQGLMGRLDVRFGRFPDGLLSPPLRKGGLTAYNIKEPLPNPPLEKGRELYTTVYLDPMFPNDSYEGAKVGKGMQMLHNLAKPPTFEEEERILEVAISLLSEGGRVVVKRPKNAPYLAGEPADESWANDVVRFDGYFNKQP